jgi:hypothetical protein
MTESTEQKAAESQPGNDSQAFWDLYLQEHQSPVNRWLHAIGTVSSWVVAGLAIWNQMWWLLLVVPIVGYGMAWTGHAFVEKNRPLSIKHPLRSFLADYRLTLLMMTGRNPRSTRPSPQPVDS